MLAWILDKNFENLGIVDVFESFIWTDRWDQAGDFELYIPPRLGIIEYLKQDNYVMIKESSKLMVIETLNLETVFDQGDMLTVSGRSLESFLDRRVVWGQTVLSGNVQNAVKRLLDENVISPEISKRKIPNFIFQASNDSAVTRKTLEEETVFNGENLYEVIQTLCAAYKLGFSVTPNYKTGEMVFKLYSGVNRSYAQDDRPWVVFSPKFGNILSSNYFRDNTSYKNACLVLGEENEYFEQVLVDATLDNSSGLDRREASADGGNIPATISHEETYEYEMEDSSGDISVGHDTVEVHERNPEQIGLMTSLGKEALVEFEKLEAFESEIDPTRQFVLGRDFFMGDIIQVVNDYGFESTARVAEIIRCHDTTGETVTPTFTSV